MVGVCREETSTVCVEARINIRRHAEKHNGLNERRKGGNDIPWDPHTPQREFDLVPVRSE